MQHQYWLTKICTAEVQEYNLNYTEEVGDVEFSKICIEILEDILVHTNSQIVFKTNCSVELKQYASFDILLQERKMTEDIREIQIYFTGKEICMEFIRIFLENKSNAFPLRQFQLCIDELYISYTECSDELIVMDTENRICSNLDLSVERICKKYNKVLEIVE